MSMTKPEFRAALRRNGFTVLSFADEFGVSIDTVYRWGGPAAVPRWASRVLALIDQHGRAHVLGTARSSAWPHENDLARAAAP